MERRFFLTWMGLSFLASTSPIAITTIANQKQQHSESNFSSSHSKPVLFYVAANGNDSWSGTKEVPNPSDGDGPFATLHRARDAIRELKRQQGGILRQSVTVFLRGGTYFLSKPLIFTPEDSGTKDFPITYKAYPNEKPVISGGQSITGWKRQGNLWIANLPEVKKGKWYFRLLRVEDDWAIRARYPNFEPNNPLTRGWLYADRRPVPQKKAGFNAGVGYIYNVGDKLEWNIVVPAAAKYRVWLRYAHNMKAYRGTELMDDKTAIRSGNSVPVPLRNLPDTGNFANFRWTLAATIDLSAGEQTLVWQNLKGGELKLDAFCLTDDPDWNPTTAIRILKKGSGAQVQQPKRGKHLIVLHAETYKKSVGRDLRVFPERALRDRLPISPRKFPNWQNWEGAEVNVFMRGNFGNSISPISGVDKENYVLLGNFSNANYPIVFGNRFFIENVREALDSPGEWYLDIETGELLYLPTAPDFPNNMNIVAPVMDRLIVLQGDGQKKSFVEYIYFQGLTFTDTDYTLADNYFVPADAAIWLSTARQCLIEDCTFTHIGGSAIRMEQRSQDNQILSNKMTHLGNGGVVLSGNTEKQPFNNLIAGNDISDIGKIYKHAGGIYLSSGSGNKIVHNLIKSTSRYGIYLVSYGNEHYSHNNIIEFNEVIDSSLETADTCAIGTLGRDKQPSGNIIRFNFIRNVVGMGTTASGQIVSPYYTWGIYLDDYSSGTTVYGNIVVGNVKGALMIHGGKDNRVENNIFIDGAKNQIELWPRDDFMKGNVIHRNIIVYYQPKAKLWRSNKNWPRDRIAECNFNLYWHSGGLDLAKTERAITSEGNFAQWQAAGFDRNSLVADPLFVAPEKNDFRLKPNSPAFRLGFQVIPVERIGLKGFNYNQTQPRVLNQFSRARE